MDARHTPLIVGTSERCQASLTRARYGRAASVLSDDERTAASAGAAGVCGRRLSTTNPAGGPPPTSTHSFGLRLPDCLNFGRIAVDQVDVYGFYTGIVCNTAHTQISHACVKWCLVGFGLTGSGQFDSIDPHASLFELIDTE